MKKHITYYIFMIILILCNTICVSASEEEKTLIDQFWEEYLLDSPASEEIKDYYINRRKLTIDSTVYDFIKEHVPEGASLDIRDYRVSRSLDSGSMVQGIQYKSVTYPNDVIVFELTDDADSTGKIIVICDFVIPEKAYEVDSLEIRSIGDVSMDYAAGEEYVRADEKSEWEYQYSFLPVQEDNILRVHPSLWDGKSKNVRILLAVSMTENSEQDSIFYLEYTKRRYNTIWLFGSYIKYTWMDVFKIITALVAATAMIFICWKKMYKKMKRIS